MTKRKSLKTVHYSVGHTKKSVPLRLLDGGQSPANCTLEYRGLGAERRSLRSLFYILGSAVVLCVMLMWPSPRVLQPKTTSPKPIKKSPAQQLPQAKPLLNGTTLASLNNPLNCPRGTVLNTVAHEDDDILFMNPTIQNEITAGMCVRTVFLTAGDDGRDSSYWMEREQGPDAAYAAMFGAPNEWTDTIAAVAGHQVTVHSLVSKPQVSLIFLQLPDGGLDGQGFASTGFESLLKLRDGQLSQLHTVDGGSVYSGVQLVDTLRTLMKLDEPSIINTQASSPELVSGDHSDHQATGYFTSLAELTYASSSKLHHYIGYQIGSMEPNLNDGQIEQKSSVFNAYDQHDSMICNADKGCFNSIIYQKYLSREYEQTR